MTGEHRRIPMAPYKALREIDGQHFTVCRWCDEPITKEDGSPNRRRNWHLLCVDEYLAGRDPARLRRIIFRRDRGLCADCGFWMAMPVPRVVAHAAPFYGRANVGRQWYVVLEWEADHIVPLIEGGRHGVSNVQTLCLRCHKAKTAREAGARAAARRGVRITAIPDSFQESLL